MLLFNFQLLRKQRRQRKFTQEQWGKILDVTGATVGNWERGDSYPDVHELSKIAMGCGVSDINIYFIERIGGQNEIVHKS